MASFRSAKSKVARNREVAPQGVAWAKNEKCEGWAAVFVYYRYFSCFMYLPKLRCMYLFFFLFDQCDHGVHLFLGCPFGVSS